jgi:hypothetical protein
MATTRSIIDTDAELEERTTALTRIVEGGNWSNAFVRHHVRQMILDAQKAAGERAAANLEASMTREWTAVQPVPAAAPRMAAE